MVLDSCLEHITCEKLAAAGGDERVGDIVMVGAACVA